MIPSPREAGSPRRPPWPTTKPPTLYPPRLSDPTIHCSSRKESLSLLSSPATREAPGSTRAGSQRTWRPARQGGRMDRYCADRMVKRLTKRAGIDKKISPHSLRHSFITAALDAGVPLHDVQEAASHADPRTTMRYDRRCERYRAIGSLVAPVMRRGVACSGSGISLEPTWGLTRFDVEWQRAGNAQ